MNYKANGFIKENIDDFKIFAADDRLIKKFLNNFSSMLLAIYLIIIFIGSIVLNIKFNAIVIVVYVSSIFIAYIIFRKSIYLRLIRDFKKLNNNLLEIN